MKRLLILVMAPVIAFAGPTTLKKGDIVPYDGVLFTHQEELDLRANNEKLKFYERREKDLNLKIDFYKENYTLWKNEATELSKDLTRAENNSFWKNAAVFTLGVLATVTAAYAVRGVVR